MPFCGVHLRGQKPLPAGYSGELRTLGDHVRKRRLDLGLRQRDVARQLCVNVNTVMNWEVGRSTPVLRYLPGIIQFLGYVPFPTDGALAERLKAYRQIRGQSQKALAVTLGVDPQTFARWESGRALPGKDQLDRIEALCRPTTRHAPSTDVQQQPRRAKKRPAAKQAKKQR